MMRLVQEILEVHAERQPDVVALVSGERRFTYGEIDRRANRLAHSLIAAGVQRGDRVGMALRNSADAVVAIFAIAKAGAVAVLINHQTKRDKLASLLGHSGAVVAFVEPLLIRQGLAGLGDERFPDLRLFVVPGNKSADLPVAKSIGIRSVPELEETQPEHNPGRAGIDLDLAFLIYTSGSTGSPKAVMCDHGNVVFVTQSIAEYLKHTERDTILSVLPLSFSYGIYQLMVTFATGGCLVLEESFAFPAAILQRLAEERVTGFAGVPTIYALLLAQDLKQFDLSHLRYLTNAAAALPEEHLRQLRNHFPEVAIYCMHGLTEVARTAYLPPEEVERRPGSVGHAIPGTELWLENEDGRVSTPGVVGELIVRGRHVMRGYWNDPVRSAERFPPGALPGERLCRSGDLFRMDEDGFLYFVSRKDDIIKSRGEKVAPREVEEVLYAITGVLEAAVIGVPDPILGEAIKAFVVAPGVTLSETQVQAFCRQRLEEFMIPRMVEFVDSLPKTMSGKIKKNELRGCAVSQE